MTAVTVTVIAILNNIIDISQVNSTACSGLVAVLIYRVFHGQNCGTWEVPGAFILLHPLMCYFKLHR